MNNFFRKNSKKVMAVLGVFLMIAFAAQFTPGGRSRMGGAGERTVATMFNGKAVTAVEAADARTEWELARHRLLYVVGPNGTQQQYPVPLAALLGGAGQAIDAKPETFLLLIKEAREMGVSVSNDELEGAIKNHVQDMPDEADANYDRARQTVYDVLLVKNLIERVGDVVKESEPARRHQVAVSQQSVSVNVVDFPASKYLASTTQPSPAEVQNQYDRYSQTLADQPDLHDPLGFGYKYPDRVKVQYIGVTREELRQAVKLTRQPIEWQTQARRLYRTHAADFYTPATRPAATQPATAQAAAAPAPAWEDLPNDIVEKVYNKVYDTAAVELSHSVQQRLADQLALDWNAYHDAVTHNQAPPTTSTGFAYNTDDYLRGLALGLTQDFHVRPVVGFPGVEWKTAQDLKTLEGIGNAHTAEGTPFPDYATTAGDAFAAASKLPASGRLSAWQPSEAVHTGLSSNPEAAFVFRLTGMDPSHPAPLDEVRQRVIDDARTQQAWNAAKADADKFMAAAKTQGLQAAANGVVPPLAMTTTDLFKAQGVYGEPLEAIPGYELKKDSVQPFAMSAIKLLTQQGPDGRKPVAEVELPTDRKVAVIELNKSRPDWLDPTDLTLREAEQGSEMQRMIANQIARQWSLFPNVAARTGYKEVAKSE